MNSVQKACGDKVKHYRKWQAELHLRHLRKTKGYEGEVYRCKYCGFYHVGRVKTIHKDAS